MPKKQTERTIVEYTPSGKLVVHGRASSYNNHKCKCDECTEAWAIYIAAGGYVKKHRESKKKKGVTINL
jgi:ribosomal protein L34E